MVWWYAYIQWQKEASLFSSQWMSPINSRYRTSTQQCVTSNSNQSIDFQSNHSKKSIGEDGPIDINPNMLGSSTWILFFHSGLSLIKSLGRLHLFRSIFTTSINVLFSLPFFLSGLSTYRKVFLLPLLMPQVFSRND